MGWEESCDYSARSDFNDDLGVAAEAGEPFGLSVFLRDGARVFHEYFTAGRGVEAPSRHCREDASATSSSLVPLARTEMRRKRRHLAPPGPVRHAPRTPLSLGVVVFSAQSPF